MILAPELVETPEARVSTLKSLHLMLDHMYETPLWKRADVLAEKFGTTQQDVLRGNYWGRETEEDRTLAAVRWQIENADKITELRQTIRMVELQDEV